MEYTKHNDSLGTSNVQHLFNDWCKAQLLPLDVEALVGFFNYITQNDLTDWLGEPSIEEMDNANDKGYGHEWYYRTPRGANIGIGFRWGFARVRGDGYVNTDDVIDFVNWILEQDDE